MAETKFVSALPSTRNKKKQEYVYILHSLIFYGSFRIFKKVLLFLLWLILYI